MSRTSFVAAFISSGSYAASGDHQQTLGEPCLLHSSPVELTTATAFCTTSLYKSSVDFRWSWTLPPVWSSVFADTNTSRWPFATCFIGSQCHSEYSSKWQSLRLTVFVSTVLPAYFNNVCIPVAGISGRANLRSTAERHDMLVALTRTQLGRRSFHVAAPTVWNALPSQLRSSSISRGQFRAGLKTHLFTQPYGHLWELLLKSVLFYITLYLLVTYKHMPRVS